MKSYFCICLLFFSGGILFSQSIPYKVSVGIQTDPDNLDPITSGSPEARIIEAQIFQPLVDFDPVTKRETPVLAEALPIVIYDQEHVKTSYTFSIRRDATWGNGSHVTARDVIFTLKAFKCRLIRDNKYANSYDPIEDIKADPIDSNKVTMVVTGRNMSYKYLCEQLSIIPEYVYDPNRALDKYAIADFGTQREEPANQELKNDVKVKALAKVLLPQILREDNAKMIGSGPYEFQQWITGQKIILSKKKNWWGDKLRTEGYFFQAYPDSIVYIILNEPGKMLDAVKRKTVDVIYGFTPTTYIREIKPSAQINADFKFYSPPTLTYSYLGINMVKPKFMNIKTRQAIAHLVDVQKIIDSVYYGLGKRVVGTISPEKKDAYNDTIKLYDFNIETAKKLLAEVGWKDSDGDGILDMYTDSVKTDLTITFLYNSNNTYRRDAGQIFKADAAKAGINVELEPSDWSNFMQKQFSRDFEITYGAWATTLNPDDPKQLFSTDSDNNHCSFGNEESNGILNSIRYEFDDYDRNNLYKQFQEITHDQVPYVFLFSPYSTLLVNKKFGEVQTFSSYPGFNPAGFMIKK